jgi:hypothetical protein
MAATPSTYRYCFGPWNLSEGQDPYGPPVRPPQTFGWKLQQLKDAGFDAMMFHDDDVVPDIDTKSEIQILKEAREMAKRLKDSGVAAEMVAPRLWFSPNTIDGAYTSNDKKLPPVRHRPLEALPRHRQGAEHESHRPLARPRRLVHPRVEERRQVR